MQNNIIQVINLIVGDYEICDKLSEDGTLFCIEHALNIISCSNCPLIEYSDRIHAKYGEYNESV